MSATTIDPRISTGPALKGGADWRSLLLGVAALLLCAGAAQAGSVFMKNGYIIQGPIVEHSDSSVVLGWNNGKVTIYRRFVEKVDFEPGEEKLVKAPETPATPEDDERVVIMPGVETEELPQTLSELVKAYNLPAALIEVRPNVKPVTGEGGEEPHGTEGGEGRPGSKPPDGETPGPTPGTGVEVVGPAPPPEGEALAARARDARWGFSLQPPQGWQLGEVQGCVSWSGPAVPEGFTPSLNVTSVRRGSLKWDEACRALREDQKSPLKDYEPVVEEPVRVAGHHAYRVAGRGEARTGRDGKERKVMVHQVLVDEGERLWLISTFVDPAMPANLSALLDRSVQTFKVES